VVTLKRKVANAARFLRNLTGPSAAVPRIVRMIRAYEPRLAEWKNLLPSEATGRRVAVLISPWLESAVPLFSLECALAMARDGMDVVIFWDDGRIFQGEAKGAEREALETLLEKASAVLPVCCVCDISPALGHDWIALAEKILQDNAIARARGEDAATAFLEGSPDLPENARNHLARVQEALEEFRPAWVFVPGGVYGTSAMYREVAGKLGIPCGTYDADEGMLLMTTDGVATHHADIPKAAALLESWVDGHDGAREYIGKMTALEIESRMAASDSWGFQLSVASGQACLPCDVLVPLNLRWDTAALSRQRVFPTVRAFIESIIQWARKHPDLHVCFRQHPCERFVFAKSSDDVSGWIRSVADQATNIHFIAADAEISTYDLLRTTRILLPHTSTIALEAAMLGIPTVLGTHCYYEAFGFAWSTEDEAGFHSLIEAALDSQLNISPKAAWEARLLYFLTQVCAPLRSPLTPAPKDFSIWVSEPPAVLWEREESRDLRRAFAEGLPVSYLRALRLCHRAAEGVPT